MAKRRPAGDGMVRRRDDGRWEGRIVIGHKENGEPLFRHVYAKTQKALLDKLHPFRYHSIFLRYSENGFVLPDSLITKSITVKC